jgi:Histidine-specific methyltransferase, SAM-dependent
MELFLSLAAELGFTSDEDVARLAHVGADNVANWRTGTVREFKPQRLRAAIDSLSFHVRSLRARAGLDDAGEHLYALHVEEGSTPADLQRQFRERVGYDYLGHRFLYFEPQGALAWENMIRAGYDQDRWLAGAADAARAWLAPGGPLDGVAARGVDLVSLGSGEGEKDARVLGALLDVAALPWITYAPVDVSIPLLVAAARTAARTIARLSGPRREQAAILPFCADFEEGALAFVSRLRTASPAFAEDGVRLILILGNVFGNVRDEGLYVHQKLTAVARPGDLVWLEVALREDDLTKDPLFQMTLPDHQETAGEANRRLLLEGPYRRWAAAIGRRPVPDVELRIAVREADDTARIPESCNFVHDLVIRDERRACTMLYSRRYRTAPLSAWFERHGFTTEATRVVDGSRGVPRVAHLLLRRV